MKVVNLITFSGQIFPLILKTLIICIEISPEHILTAAWVLHELSCTTSQALAPLISPCKHRPRTSPAVPSAWGCVLTPPPHAWLILLSLSHPSDLSLSSTAWWWCTGPLLPLILFYRPLLFLYSTHTVPWCGPLWLYHFLGSQTMSFRTELPGLCPSALRLQHWNNFCHQSTQ